MKRPKLPRNSPPASIAISLGVSRACVRGSFRLLDTISPCFGGHHNRPRPVSASIYNYQKYLFVNKEKINLNDVVEMLCALTCSMRGRRRTCKPIADRALSAGFGNRPRGLHSRRARDFFIWELEGCPLGTCKRLGVSPETGPAAFFKLLMVTDVNPSFST